LEERDATIWYRKESGDELALRFRRELKQVIHRIGKTPQQFPFVTAWEQKALLKVFPYAIIFEQLGDGIRINAIAHTSREPNYWQGRSNRP
jgi:plasmid stabilization system protein ParE